MWWKQLDDAVAAGHDEWCRAPDLASIGHALLEPGRDETLRIWACRWLEHFPSEETVRRLADTLGERDAPLEVRDQAAWTLSYRQLQTCDDALEISPEIERAADDALLSAWDRGEWNELPQLVSGARHSRDDRLFARLAAADIPIETAARALEAFATPALARRCLAALARVRDHDRVRMIRLVGATLGGEAVQPLLAFGETASIGDRVEAIFTALALDHDVAREPVQRFLGSLTLGATFEARARWHESNPGVLPIVRALRVARITSTIQRSERAVACARAAADLAALGTIAPYGEQYLVDLWRFVALRSRSPDEVIRCVEGIASPFAGAGFLVTPYLDALAATGRFRRLAEVASREGAAAHATWVLARHRRPLLALASARRTRVPTVLSCAGEALAWSEVGREDLASRALAERLTAGEPLWGEDGAPPFPGRDEIWRMNELGDPVLRAVVAGSVDALRAMRVDPAPAHDPDVSDRAPLAALEASLTRELQGATVALLGRFHDEAGVRAWLAREGATVADGAFARVPFFVAGAGADAETLATLAQRGALRLRVPVPAVSTFVEPPMILRPHRVLLRVPSVRVAGDLGAPLAQWLGDLLFDHFVRDGRVALELAAEEEGDVPPSFAGEARDEVLSLELDLARDGAASARLTAQRREGSDQYDTIGAQPLSQLITSCLRRWLDARGLTRSPHGPLPAFKLDDALACAAWLVAHQADKKIAKKIAMGKVAKPLRATTLRALDARFGLSRAHAAILTLEPDDPRARFAECMADSKTSSPSIALREIMLTAPRWWPPAAALGRDSTADRDERLDALSAAIDLAPGDADLLDEYSSVLAKEGRYEEAYRYADRATRIAPYDAGHHVRAIEHGVGIGRMGAKLADAKRRVELVERLVERGESHPGSPDLVHLRLRYDASLMYAGRLDEAIALREGLIGGQSAWPQQNKALIRWRTERKFLAHSYALEGAHRGEPGRTLEGYHAVRPADGTSMVAYIEALLVLGRDEHAALAFGHLHKQKQGRGPMVRVAGAKALAATGRLAEALEQLEVVVHGQPQRRLDTEIDRVLRVLATHPASAWEAEIQRRLDRGATELARHVARNAADFVPGMADSAVVRAALGDAPPDHDPSCLAPLAGLVPAAERAAIDGLFDGADTGDRLAAEWPSLLPAGAAGRVYLFASALTRYFARSGAGLAMGLRHAAAGALESLWHVEVAPDLARALLASIERASRHVGDADLDRWLLRIERALSLEQRRVAVSDLPRLSALLRGDDTIAAELREARALSRRDDGPSIEASCVLFERCARAIGSYAVADWVNAAVRCRIPAVLRDAAWTAAVANAFHGVPAVALAKGYLADARGDLALEVVSRFLGGAGQDWREERLAELAPAWAAAKIDVPLAFDAAQTAGFEAIQEGDWDRADRCYRLCTAIDPGNAQCLKNLGIASARLGRSFATVLAFSEADAAQGPLWAGAELIASQKPDEAQAVLGYASYRFTTAAEWLQLALACWYTGDEETKADAIGRALELDPSAVAPAFLNGYAAAKQELGELDACETASKRLIEVAGTDPTMKSCALHNLACVALARGDARALALAEEALALNPLEDNIEPFTETVDRCKRGDPHPVVASRAKSPEGRAFRALEDGDPKSIAMGETPRLLRAAIAAARHRFSSENDVVVTARAREAARAVLAGTHDATDRDAALARIAALRIVEDAVYPVDPPALLGAQLPRDVFRDQLGQRET